MSTFIGGPADKMEFRTVRAPVLMRVAVNTVTRKVDVLDSLGDMPDPAETVYLYRRKPGVGISRGFWDGRDKQGRRTGGVFESTTYEYWPDQPAQDALADNLKWNVWCGDKENREPGKGVGGD